MTIMKERDENIKKTLTKFSIVFNAAVIVATMLVIILNPIFFEISHSSQGMIPIIVSIEYTSQRVILVYLLLALCSVSLSINFLSLKTNAILVTRLVIAAVSIGLIFLIYFSLDILIIDPEGNPPSWIKTYHFPLILFLIVGVVLIFEQTVYIIINTGEESTRTVENGTSM